MLKHFKDYYWKGGIPYGISATEDLSEKNYKIVMDPYRKRISIEVYDKSVFSEVAYDSALFDFRHLKSPEQAAWQKVTVKDEENSMECLIRNQDDRLVFFETYWFEQGLCRDCVATSPHGYPLSKQHMFYKFLKDPINGVLLLDRHERPVMYKLYDADPHTGEFTKLLKEEWNPKENPLLIQSQRLPN